MRIDNLSLQSKTTVNFVRNELRANIIYKNIRILKKKRLKGK